MEVDDGGGGGDSVDRTATSSPSISITALSGSQTSSTRALCHLLEFDDAKILLDAGVNSSREEFSYDDHSSDRIEYLDRLRECVGVEEVETSEKLLTAV